MKILINAHYGLQIIWIGYVDLPGIAFIVKLKQVLATVVGKNGSFPVFVHLRAEIRWEQIGHAEMYWLHKGNIRQMRCILDHLHAAATQNKPG